MAAKRRVLVCDDDPVILWLLEVNLELEGFDVLTGTNGEEGVEIAKREKPDLVILDIMMPRMDGYEACRQLKEDASTQHIPVVFLSAKAQASDIERGKSYGVAEYLTKPFDPTDLTDLVFELIGDS